MLKRGIPPTAWAGGGATGGSGRSSRTPIDAVLLSPSAAAASAPACIPTTRSASGTDGALVPIAKAYSGLTDEEIRRVDAFVRRNMIEKFGPVRTVKPELVFELAFEGLNARPGTSPGIAVRFPRILRWRTDKTAAEADTLDTIRGPPRCPITRFSTI